MSGSIWKAGTVNEKEIFSYAPSYRDYIFSINEDSHEACEHYAQLVAAEYVTKANNPCASITWLGSHRMVNGEEKAWDLINNKWDLNEYKTDKPLPWLEGVKK